MGGGDEGQNQGVFDIVTPKNYEQWHSVHMGLRRVPLSCIDKARVTVAELTASLGEALICQPSTVQQQSPSFTLAHLPCLIPLDEPLPLPRPSSSSSLQHNINSNKHSHRSSSSSSSKHAQSSPLQSGCKRLRHFVVPLLESKPLHVGILDAFLVPHASTSSQMFTFKLA